jgi:hypothetical protein
MNRHWKERNDNYIIKNYKPNRWASYQTNYLKCNEEVELNKEDTRKIKKHDEGVLE